MLTMCEFIYSITKYSLNKNTPSIVQVAIIAFSGPSKGLKLHLPL